MAITTLAQVVDGMLPQVTVAKTAESSANGASQLLTNWYSAGYPPTATANTSGVSGQALTSSPAALPFKNPVSGNSYLTGFLSTYYLTISNTSQRSTLLVDRLWENSGLSPTLTTAQTVNSVAWPARDLDESTNGRGVFIAVEVSGAIGSGTGLFSISYTNSNGTAGKTAGSLYSTRSSAPEGHWFPIGLASGDVGVRSIQSFTISATLNSGTIHLVAYRPIAMIGAGGRREKTAAEDALTLGMPPIWNNSVLQLVGNMTGNGSSMGGSWNYIVSQG